MPVIFYSFCRKLSLLLCKKGFFCYIAGKICILDIDVQGVKSVKETEVQAKYVFLSPPSLPILEQRLRDRGTETEEAIAKVMTSSFNVSVTS